MPFDSLLSAYSVVTITASTNNPATRLDGPAFGMKPIASMEEYEKAEARDDYIRENLYNTGDYVENIKTNAQGVIVRRGTNYVVIEDVNDKLHKSWIYDVVPMQGVISDELQEKGKKFTEGWMERFEEDNKELIKEIENLENPFDTKVANALANANVTMEINKNTK